ncbi:MAG: Gfo/Idh/MocA family oxidoreductase [Lentisphaerae bacterium]|nr:Gfo/Idh/MocA family oxidoreductase [Lentisphaerota bacterium]
MMKKIKVAVAGFGDRGYSLVVPLISGEFRSRAEIVAVLDNNSVKLDFARGVLKEFPGVQYFTSLKDFLKCDADLVLVTPPQFAHRDLACAALDAGFHIFLEKPMARNEKECKEIIAAEKRSGKNVFMGFNLRHHPVCVRLMELLPKAGKMQQMVCTDFFAGGYSYFRRWHRFEENSGGLTVEKGCHSIDLLNLFSGSVPLRVAAFGGLDRFTPDPEGSEYCSGCAKTASCPFYMDIANAEEQTLIGTGIPGIIVNGGKKLDLCVMNSGKDTMDNTTVLIEYANGCRAMLGECFTSSVKRTSGRQFTLNGWDGQLWSSLTDRTIRFYPNRPGEKGPEPEVENLPRSTGSHGGADPLMLDYILNCLAKGTPNTRMLTRDGYYAVAVAAAAERAVREKRVVDIEPLDV